MTSKLLQPGVQRSGRSGAGLWGSTRITTRISLALTAASVVLFGAYGLWLLRAEERDLFRTAEREVRLLGRSLQAAATQVVQSNNLLAAEAMIARLQTIDPSLQVIVLSPSGVPLVASRDARIHDMVRIVAGQVAQRHAQGLTPPQDRVLAYDMPDAPRTILAGLPLVDDRGQLLALLVIEQSLDELRRDLDATRHGVAVSIGLFAVVAWLVVSLVGAVSLARPMRELALAMRRVRSGNLSRGVDSHGGQEINELIAEFNVMVSDLLAARLALEEAAEARRRDQRALQEADKLVTIGQLSAGLAHEIGSPLQVLGGRARSLLKRADDPAEVARIAQILVDQTARIARIVGQLQLYTRLRPARTGLIHPLAAVQQIVDLMELEARRRQVALRLDCPADLPQIEADGDQLQQLVLNLLNNALQATPPGGTVTVTLRMEPPEHPQELHIAVADTGRGIPDEMRGKLFDPFFSTRTTEGGTGLGLAVVKSIVTEHRGQIHIDSEVGRGTTMTVILPKDAGHLPRST